MSLNKSQALDAAKQYVLKRDLHAAVEIYREIVEADPTDLTSINTLGDLDASTGRIQEAITEFSRVAAVYIDGGFSRKAIATLKKIIAIDPANTETAIKLADLYAQAGLPSEARQHYLQIADALTRKGRGLDALGVYSKVVDLDPLNTPSRIKLGELCLREGMNEQAYDAFMTAAAQLSSKGENRRALNAYNEALSIKPDSVEALTAARNLMTMLGFADPDRSLRGQASQSGASGDLAKEKSASAAGSDSRSPSTPLDDAPQSKESSFVVQEISKAEILVAYGQVNQAIGMLRNVLRDKPDCIDVHIKLKDIYLRTGMMAEAATECRELERIHQSRGESDRARDYAVRASRLTQLLEQPSGDLDQRERKIPGQPERKSSQQPEPRINPAPLRVVAPHDSAPKRLPVTSMLEATTAQPSRTTISVVDSDARVVDVAVAPAEVLQPGSHSAPVEALRSLVVAKPDDELSTKSSIAVVTHAPVEVIPRVLPALFADSLPVKNTRGRVTAAATAAGVFALLAVSAVIGGFAYDAHLDKQYQALALAAPPIVAPAPPPALEAEESQSPAENSDEPMMVVVTPAVQNEPAQRESRGVEPVKNEPPPPAPQPASEPAKVTTRPATVPPGVAVNPDSRAGVENRTPLGVPVEVPIGHQHPAEPPPRAVRQSPGVVPGGAVRKVDPVYPSAARQAAQSGAVSVEVMINEQGSVTSARALSGPPLLRNAAVMAARSWKFRPSTLGGVPVTTTTTIVFNFKL